jgi:hypothetical protein
MGNDNCVDCSRLKAILEPLSDVPGSTRHLEYIRRCLDEAISKIGPKDGFGYLRKVVNAMIADIKSNDASKDYNKKLATCDILCECGIKIRHQIVCQCGRSYDSCGREKEAANPERERAANICERMVIGGRAWSEEQSIAARALFAAAENIRNGEIK